MSFLFQRMSSICLEEVAGNTSKQNHLQQLSVGIRCPQFEGKVGIFQIAPPETKQYAKHITKIDPSYIQKYPRYTRVYQDIQNTKRRRGGPAAAWYFVYLGISLYILEIFGYIWIYLDICVFYFRWWWCMKFPSLMEIFFILRICYYNDLSFS